MLEIQLNHWFFDLFGLGGGFFFLFFCFNLGKQSKKRRLRVEAPRAHGSSVADVFRDGLDEAGRRQSHRLRSHEVNLLFTYLLP